MSEGDGRTFYDGAICNGTQCWNLSYKEGGELESVIISKSIIREQQSGRSLAPWPLKALYVGLKPLDEVIRDAKQVGETEVIGRPCDVYRFLSVPTERASIDVFYTLDRETSVPLRLEFLQPGDDPARPSGAHGIWEAKSLDTVGEHHMPLTSTSVSYRAPDESGNAKRNYQQTITVESLEYDQPIEASLFQPQFEPGVTIIDMIHGTTQSPPTPETEPITAIPTTANAAAMPPTPWSHYAPLAGIGFGLCVLAVGFLLWMRGARVDPRRERRADLA